MSAIKRVHFDVSFVLPEGATIDMAGEYVVEAVGFLKGGRKPPGVDPDDPDGDPMFGLDPDTVEVIHQRTT
jgi:hypothetical protein